MARIRISDMANGATPLASNTIFETSVVNAGAPSGFDTRKYTVANILAITSQIANGGTGGTSGPTALAALGALPLAGGTLTGALSGTTANFSGLATFGANVTVAGTLAATGAISSAGGIASTGALSGLSLVERDGTGTWVVYSNSDKFNVNIGGNDQLSVDTDGNAFIRSNCVPTITNNSNCGVPSFAWISVNAYAHVTTSDASLKTNIEDAPPALDAVLKLAPKTFNWKEGKDRRRHHGFLAGDVKDALGSGFGGYVAPPDGDGPQGISYGELTVVLWRAVQELSAKVAALEGATDVPEPPR